jgi:ribosomal protein L11 methyltransferase
VIQAILLIPFDAADAIDEQLLELGDGRWMVTQDLPTRRASLIGIFETTDDAVDSWSGLAAQVPQLRELGSPEMKDLPPEDWRDSYKAHFKAWKFGRLHWVPVWERHKFSLPQGETVIWLDPGLAFGTGNHETTRLCCERLVELASRYPQDSAVMDAGCGSGILALSAARLGFRDVSGFDNDPEAVRVSQENAGLNDLADAVRFFVGDLESGLRGREFKIVLANIQADVLIRYSHVLISAVASGGALVLSGILAGEIEQVARAFRNADPGWSFESRTLGEWSDALLLRPAL